MFRLLHTLKKLAITLVLLLCVFVMATVIHSRIDSSLTADNMNSSLKILDAEGVHPSFGGVIGREQFLGFTGDGNTIDNFTNMWMLQSADSNHGFDVKEYREGTSYDEARRPIILGGRLERALKSGWHGGSYWNGYRIVLKPLLILFDIHTIRLLQVLVFMLALIWALAKVGRKIGIAESLFLLLSVWSINPLNALINMDQAPDFIQAFLSIVIVLRMLEAGLDRSSFAVVFMAFGMLEAFINCLIMPLVTLGLPLVTVLLWKFKRRAQFRECMIDSVVFCVVWGVGYTVSFLSVWLFTAFVTGSSPIDSMLKGIDAFLVRSGSEETNLMETISRSVQLNVNKNVPQVWGLFLTYVWFVTYGMLRKGNRRELMRPAPLIVAAFIPFLWIVVLNNHSSIHFWMVHDIFCISVWALLCADYYLLRSVAD